MHFFAVHKTSAGQPAAAPDAANAAPDAAAQEAAVRPSAGQWERNATPQSAEAQRPVHRRRLSLLFKACLFQCSRISHVDVEQVFMVMILLEVKLLGWYLLYLLLVPRHIGVGQHHLLHGRQLCWPTIQALLYLGPLLQIACASEGMKLVRNRWSFRPLDRVVSKSGKHTSYALRAVTPRMMQCLKADWTSEQVTLEHQLNALRREQQVLQTLAPLF